MIIKPLTEHHLEFLSLNRGCTGSSESIHVKMPHCWKSRRGSYVLIERQENSYQKACMPNIFVSNENAQKNRLIETVL